MLDAVKSTYTVRLYWRFRRKAISEVHCLRVLEDEEPEIEFYALFTRVVLHFEHDLEQNNKTFLFTAINVKLNLPNKNILNVR